MPGRELVDCFLRDAAVELVAVAAGTADRALSAAPTRRGEVDVES